MLGSTETYQKGEYGEKGIPDSNNYPGARTAAVTWTDNAGNMWMFGGNGVDSTGESGIEIHRLY
jgi:hypothetical protein